MTKITQTIDYYVFIRESFNRKYYCVAGREVDHSNAICFLTNEEAVSYAETKSKTLHEPRSFS